MDEKSQISRGFVWLGAASSAIAVIDGLSSLVIVWFLSREEMGIATLSWAVAVFLEAFSGLGIGTALVRAKEITPRQLSFCHTYAIGFAAVLTGLMCLAAPLIAQFYGSAALTPMICVSALKLLFVGICLVPLQSLNRALDFPKVSAIITAATLFAASLRIGLAASGVGAWSPVIANTMHGVFLLLGTLALSRHWPRFGWAWSECRELRAFGLKLTGSSALYQFYRNADFYFIGRFLGTEMLGLYRVAYDLAMVPALMVLNVVGRASFPVYARIAGDPPRLARTFSWNTRNLALLVFPTCVVIGFAGPSLLAVLSRNQQWSEAGPMVWVLCLAAALRCIDQFFPQLFNATGRAGYSLLDSIFSTVTFCGLFAVSLVFFQGEAGVLAVCASWAIGYILLFAPLWMMARSVVPLTLGRFVVDGFFDAAKGTLVVAACLAPTLLIPRHHVPPSALMALQIAVGAVAFLLWLRWGLKVGFKFLLRSGKATPDEEAR